MQKKVIKRKKSPNTASNKTNIQKAKANKTGKIVFLLASIAIILATFSTLGIEATILIGILIAIVYGIWTLLQRVKSKAKQRKIISIILFIM